MDKTWTRSDNDGWEDDWRWLPWLLVRVRGKLNGHGGIVHGRVLSLLFDEVMGWAYECLRLHDWDNNRINGTT
jgi:hypothetical protein